MKSHREWGDFDFSDEEMLERLRAARRGCDPGDAVRTFYEAYAERVGKPRWGEKTPTLRAEDAADPARTCPRRASST